MNSMEVMGLNEITETIFIKDFSRENEKLKVMEQELERIKDTDSVLANRLIKDIYLKKQGIYGESNVYFELKNSLLPMLCFHDITIKTGENSAQIDFLVITNKFMCIMETKNLVGDITINQDGDFIREIKYKEGVTREGMYNPITQGRRHARILKKALIDAGVTEVENFHIEAISVMANHKNIINKQDAPEDISRYIYRCDQIVNYLEREMSSSKYGMIISDSKMKFIANKVLSVTTNVNLKNQQVISASSLNCAKNKVACNNVLEFSNKNVQEVEALNSKEPFVETNINSSSQCEKSSNALSLNKDISVSLNISDYQDDKLIRMLRKFRYEKAQENNRKPYEVFTNKEMELLVSNKPKTINDLKKFNLRSWVINELGMQLLQVINPGMHYPDNNFNTIAICRAIENKLKNYRNEISVSKNIKPYEIFTNAEITKLVVARPSTLDELFEIKGFNRRDKLIKYGNDVLKILNA